jgi:hypothetical protein
MLTQFHNSIGGLVAGFGDAAHSDLADIPFTAATAANWTQLTTGAGASRTLAVGDSSHAGAADITLLGQYMAANFQIGDDGHGGTLVTDPAAAATDSNPIALTTPHG